MGLLTATCLFFLGSCGPSDPRPPPVPGAPEAPAAPRGYDAQGRWESALPPRPGRPNLVLVLVEDLRHDALSPGSFPGATALLHAVTPRPEPTAAWASLLTGRAPWQHRLGHADPVPRLEPGYVTLPEILRHSAGYATRAFVSDARLARGESLWQGLEVHPERVGLAEAARALPRWLSTLPSGMPFAAVLHADEARAPYGERNHVPRVPGAVLPEPSPAEPFADLDALFTSRGALLASEEQARREGGAEAVVELRRSRLRRLWQPPLVGWRGDPPGAHDEALARWRAAYDGGAAWVTRLLQDLLAALATAGHGDDTLVLFTSSGGTAFLEHGILGSGRQLHDEQVRIPFLLLGPTPWSAAGAPRGARELTASLLDVLPTVLDVLGLPALEGLEGRSLLPDLVGAANPLPERPVLSEEDQDGDNTGEPQERATLVSVRTPRWKYIVRYDLRRGTVVEQAFDLQADPGERHDLAGATGVAAGLPWDPETCAAVERVRDGLWGSVDANRRTGSEIYSKGQPVRVGRPPPCAR